MFNEMYYDELNQLIDLRNLLGVASAPRTTMNLLGNSVANATYATPSGTVITTGAQAIGQAGCWKTSASQPSLARSRISPDQPRHRRADPGCRRMPCGRASPGQHPDRRSVSRNAVPEHLPGSNHQWQRHCIRGTPLDGRRRWRYHHCPGLIPAGAVITVITPKANAVPTGVVISGSKVITG